VKRFIALAETCEARIPLPEIARLLGTNVRSLRNYVGRHLGISPSRFLRRQRLIRARERIIAGECVTRAAVEFGFWQLSHFSRYYRDEFGEYPSVTLQRGRP
jgi:transcriptional regulator GlxA family with amidase domain